MNEQTYAEDVAETRAQEGVIQAKLDMLFKYLQITSMREVEEDNQEYVRAYDRASQRISRLIMVFIVVSALPFVLLAKPLTMMFVGVGTALDHAVRGVFRGVEGLFNIMGNIFSFFFGFKRHRDEEKKIREEDEYPYAKVFMERKVETSTSAGGGGSAGK